MSIDGTPITLWCFVQGSSSIFKVNIGTNNDIYDLKEAIKSKKPNDTSRVDADKLRLWSVNVASISDISEDMLNDDNELKEERNTIANTFFSVEGRNIRVVIKIPVNGKSKI